MEKYYKKTLCILVSLLILVNVIGIIIFGVYFNKSSLNLDNEWLTLSEAAEHIGLPEDAMKAIIESDQYNITHYAYKKNGEEESTYYIYRPDLSNFR